MIGSLRRLVNEWALAVVLGAIALLACAKLGEDVFAHETGTFDGAIQQWMLGHQNVVASAIFLAITYCGSVGVSLLIASLSAVWLWSARSRRVAAITVVAPATATGLFTWAKLMFARARPTILGHIAPHSYSFPSGHATASAAVWCTLSYITYREGLTPRSQAIWVAIIPPLLIGLSRVYLGVHWATDVLAGWSLGLLITVVGGVFYDRNRRRRAALDAPMNGLRG
jgi:membrane-associated phospholipid phosphatase